MMDSADKSVPSEGGGDHPVDLVYLWCDAADPVFRAKRTASAAKAGVPLNDDSNGDARYRSNDELRYSLRSVERYAPWVHRVFICMDDDQTPPAWLDLGNPRLRIVRHSEFVPGEFLPTFNSTTIEHFLWRIPGLSERFLYANDDMLFWSPVSQDFFFAADGKPYCRFRELMPHAGKEIGGYYRRVSNAADLFRAHHAAYCADAAASMAHWPHHNIDGYIRSDLETIHALYRDAIAPTLRNPFRTDDKANRAIFSHEGIQSFGWHYRQVGGENPETAIMPSFWSLATAVNAHSTPGLFCFNDHERLSDYERRHGMRLISELLLPGPSGFEIQATSSDEEAGAWAENRRAAVRRHLERYCETNDRDNYSGAARNVLARLKREARPASEHPLISVIVSICNAERTLNDCLTGVFSAEGAANVEVICVDAGSSDDSMELLDDWAKASPCLRIVARDGAGPDAARKAGIKAARSENRLFLVADDRLVYRDVLRQAREQVENAVRATVLSKEMSIDIAGPDIRPVFEKRDIPIVLSTDENYLPYLEVVIRSIVANAENGNLDILVLHVGIDADVRRRFVGGFEGVERLSIRFVDVGDAVKATGIDKYRPSPVMHFTAAALFRLILPRLLPAYDKIIYLDVDLCVRGNIVDLYDADLGECLLGGVRDSGMEDLVLKNPNYVEFAASYGYSNWDGYINSGVLVMNLAAFRAADGLVERIVPAAIGNSRYFCDQDALNFLCNGRIRLLDPRWDAITVPTCIKRWLGQLDGPPKIYHYCSKAKPWSHPETAYANYWWHFAPCEYGVSLWRKAFGAKAQVSIGKDVAASVVLPVFNAEPYLAHMLFSYSAQTLGNIEIICIDDGSTDGSRRICERFAAFDSRIRVVSQPRQGGAAARNRGIAEARGRWLFFGDADDFCRPEMLEKMVSAGERDEVDVVVAGWQDADAQTGLLSLPRMPNEHTLAGRKADCLADGENVFWGAGLDPWNKLFKADFVRANGLAFRQTKHADAVFFVSSALAGAHGIAFVPSSHYYHRVNKLGSHGGAAREELAGERLAGLLSALLEVKPLLENRDGRLQARFYGASVLHLLRVVLSCGTRQGCATLLDALRKDALASLAFPSMDVDKVELGRHRRIFDLVRSGGDLSDILLARCDLLVWQNGEAHLAISNMHGQLDFQKRKIAERDKKLKDLNREIAAGKDSLKKATAAAKQRGREIKALKSSLTYRVGAALTWPLRKAWDAVRGS